MANSVSATYFETRNLDGHMAVLRQVIDESLADPEVTNLAVRLVSGSFDYVEDPRTGRRIPVVEAWGKQFHAPQLDVCPPEDASCELAVLWTFCVQNMRYTYDMNSTDQFKTVKQTLLTGGGDCDDQTILLISLARALGFNHAVARVISSDGENWVHVFPIIGCPKDAPSVWIPMDMTVQGFRPGDMAPFAAARDFDMA